MLLSPHPHNPTPMAVYRAVASSRLFTPQPCACHVVTTVVMVARVMTAHTMPWMILARFIYD